MCWPTALARRRSCRAHEDARAEPVSDAAGAREHGNLHANLAASIRQHAGQRMPPPQSARLKLGLDSPHALFGRPSIRRMARVGAVAEERASRLRANDRPEPVGAPSIEPAEATIFNQAMRDLSTSISPAVAASFDWSRFPVIADIGGGIGSQLSSILDAHPSCRGILFDQPSTVAEAPDTAEWSVSAETSSRKSPSKPTRT